MRLTSKGALVGLTLLTASAFLPSFLSTKLGSHLLSRSLSHFLDHPIDFKASLSWVNPIELHNLTYIDRHFQVVVDEILTDQSLWALLFSNHKLNVSVNRFEFIWGKNLLLPIQQASLIAVSSNGFTSKPMLLELHQGKVSYPEASDEPIQSLEGFMDIAPHLPIFLKLNGRCNPSGELSIEGKIDPKTYSGELDLDIKNCSTHALPLFSFQNVLAPFFDASLHYKGDADQGSGQFNFSSEGLKALGSFGKIDDRFFIQEKTTLSFSSKNPLKIGNLELSAPQIDLSLDKGSFETSNIHSLKDLDLTLRIKTSEVNLLKQNKGPFSFSGHLSQIEDGPVSIQGQIIQKEVQLLQVQGTLPFFQNSQGKLSLLTQKLPLALISQDAEKALGSYLNSNLELNFLEHSANFTFKGSTPYVSVLSASGTLNPNLISIDKASGSYDKPDLKGSFTLENGNLNLLDLSKSLFDLQVKVDEAASLPSAVFPIKAEAKATSLSSIFITLNSPLGELSGNGSFDLPKNLFTFKDRWKGSFGLLPSLFPKIPLQTEVTGDILIQTGSTQNNLGVKILLAPLSFNEANGLMLIDTTADLECDLMKNHFKGSLKGQIKDESTSGSFSASLDYNDGLIQQGSLKLIKPPLEQLKVLDPSLDKLSQFFGKNLQGTVDFSGIKNGYKGSIQLSSENLQAEGSFTLNDTLSLDKPLLFSVHLVDLDLPFLTTPLPFKLKKPCDIRLKIKSLKLPLIDPRFEDLDCQGEIVCENIALTDKQRVVHIDALQGTLQKKKGQGQLDFVLNSDIYSSGAKALTTGSLLVEGHLNQIYGPIKNLDFTKSSIQIDLKTDSFPTLALDFIANTPTLPFSSSLGSSLSGAASITHSPGAGLLSVAFQGQDTLIRLNAKKNQDVYVLSNDAIFQTRISPELSELFFKKHLLGIEKIGADHPIALRVNKDGSQFSLFPFEVKKLKVSEATLDLGRVQLIANGLFPTALNLLKASSKSNTISVWFQPIQSSVNQGILDIPRFDFLVSEAFQMALWGSVDLNKDQVGMILGLTAPCLQKAFGLSNLPKSYVLQIPISGPLDDIQIDTKKATSKIAKIIALNHGGSLVEQFGGKQGAIIGGLMKELSKLPDEDKRAPDPKTPFPWEGSTQKTSNSEKPKKKAIRSSDSPVKQLMRMFF